MAWYCFIRGVGLFAFLLAIEPIGEQYKDVDFDRVWQSVNLIFFHMKKKSMQELNRLKKEEILKAKKLPVSLILDNVRSAYNVGSCFRTADAFRIESLILGGFTAKPPHREIMKTALGSTESVQWNHNPSTIGAVGEIKKQGKFVVAVEQTHSSMALEDFMPEAGISYAFVFGNEAFGIEDPVLRECDGFLEIPQFGIKHSLNISVSLGIILWHFFLRYQELS
jgi:23S rRNA (guanosine2251-2'-O)-methyltransferase